MLDELTDPCAQVAFDYGWRPRAHDADDDLVLETAINGGTDVVASFNVADMQTGTRGLGIGVERPGVVTRRID